MKEINLGRILIENRHKRGITQDELAAYIGVSKAAVSKWETGMTYPDITLLPRLAAYFNISVDELIGYEPQLEKAEIRAWYNRLAKEFVVLPFEEALEHCREMVKKYYACYPFLFYVGVLLVNHSMLAGSPERSAQILEEAKEIFCRVKKEAEDPVLGKEAVQMEAYCLLALGRPVETLDLLDLDELEAASAEQLLAAAYQMTGDMTASRRVLQVGIYKSVVSLSQFLSSYMALPTDSVTELEQICGRFQALADAFHLEALHPSTMLSCYLAIAQGWASHGEKEKALWFLEKYTNLATGDIYPLRLHGDSFFDLLDDWIKESLPLGSDLPREESIIRKSMIQALNENPAFQDFSADVRFQRMVSRLKNNEARKR